MTPVCEDWRGLPAQDAVALVAAEVRVWRRRLDWDVSRAWSLIEPARAAGHLPGFVARDSAGRVTGWTCFLVHRDCLQVAILVAESCEVTSALVDGIVSSAEAACATSFALSVRDAAPGLREALTAQGIAVTTYRYLGMESLTPAADQASNLRRWQGDDVDRMARLCARAYARSHDVRAFAVDGTPDEWSDYVTGLVTRPGGGSFLPDASFAAGTEAGELDAAVITTELAPRTSHIAQLAVDPEARRRGLGRTLMRSAMSRAAAIGYTRMTLLVAKANTPAARLYDQLGFRDYAAFVVAAIGQPRRSTSIALATIGDSARL